MGEIWAGFDAALGRRVALKLLRRQRAKEGLRLRREAQALARLSHPNVVRVHGIEVDRGQMFIAMELVLGQTLRQWQDTMPRPSWKACVRAYIGAGRGLAAAHGAGLIHRDFKPSNCMIDGDGEVKVLDFGLVSWAGTDPADEFDDGVTAETSGAGDTLSRSLTRTGAIIGTQAYMSPEALRGASFDDRSDQFSFCIALYEAVYGVRPAVSQTTEGRDSPSTRVWIAPPKYRSAVPLRLRRILLRGLEVDAERRWPSMSALLHQLERTVAPRQLHTLVVSAAIAVFGAGLGTTHYLEAVNRCTGAAAQLEGVWDDTRRQAVRNAILGTNLAYAEDALIRVQTKLDDYTTSWAAQYTDACAATAVRREQSEEDRNLRMVCLREGRRRAKATVDVLMEADRQVVLNSTSLVMELPELSRCDDVEDLRQHSQRISTVNDDQQSRETSILRAGLAAAKAERHAGRYSVALEKVEPVAKRAEALEGNPRIQAAALLERGRLLDDNGRRHEAEKDLTRAFALASEHDRDDLAFEAARRLSSVTGADPSRSAEALLWIQVAMPLASGSPRKQAACLKARGTVLAGQGEYKLAEASYRRALQLVVPMREETSRDIAVYLNDLGNMLSSQGRHQEAQQLHQRALNIRESTLGPGHPNTAMSLNNLGIALEGLGDYQRAERHFRRALQIRERTLLSSDPHLAISVDSLAIVLYMQRRYEQAEFYYRRSLQLRREAPDPAPLGLATSLNNLGTVLSATGHQHAAARHYEQALRLEEKILRSDHPAKAFPLMGLAESSLALRDFAGARDYAARAVAIWAAADVDPARLAEARFALARALWPQPEQRSRASELVEQARATYTRVGADDRLAEIEHWLERREP
ncbi:MAG: serine/threonine-protein kinase [Deltaproteobacteria bacterium]|nr:serine/threonine-protein kinase [Deltaproteobacteria bacterium]